MEDRTPSNGTATRDALLLTAAGCAVTAATLLWDGFSMVSACRRSGPNFLLTLAAVLAPTIGMLVSAIRFGWLGRRYSQVRFSQLRERFELTVNSDWYKLAGRPAEAEAVLGPDWRRRLAQMFYADRFCNVSKFAIAVTLTCLGLGLSQICNPILRNPSRVELPVAPALRSFSGFIDKVASRGYFSDHANHRYQSPEE
jgi:hypothetical protein